MKQSHSDRAADLIKMAAVVASATRWVGALAASEGLYIPPEWAGWWRVLSFVMAAAMAVVEALAFSYALRAWRYMRPDSPQAARMMLLIVIAAVTFVAVMTPSIVAYVQHTEIDRVLSGAGLWLWGVAVTLSTIVVLAMVGYAQKRDATPEPPAIKLQAATEGKLAKSDRVFVCDACGEELPSSQTKAAHVRWNCPARAHASGNGHEQEPEAEEMAA